MSKKQFKAESKKLLDMMVNSIYTHKEIFLRELISNASDAIDKLYYRSLTDDVVGLSRDEYYIRIEVDSENRVLTVSDNGCGMSAKELESNLGTIAHSGSFNFKKEQTEQSDVEIIGQFGVGFYSAFMVSDRIEVESLAFGETDAYRWTSSGCDGYYIEPCDKIGHGTVISMHIKDDTETDNYSEFLDNYRISEIVKKYSDYIRYPIIMDFEVSKPKDEQADEYITEVEQRTLNSMVPLWRKSKSEIAHEEYDSFYKDKFYDFESPLSVIHTKAEGQATYDALMFIPSLAPYDYYTKEYEKGLQLYSNGVLIMEKCADLLPDYFSFVRGLVDSADLSLNVSRELLQHDYQLKLIAKNIEKKIKSELLKLLNNDREKYEKFFTAFGVQLKFGLYSDYGMHKDLLKDLVMFKSFEKDKLVTLSEYVEAMKEEQTDIYYACGETVGKARSLPQTDAVIGKGFDVLCLTDNIDEFALQILGEFEGKHFINVCDDKLNLSNDEENGETKKLNDENSELLEYIKDALDGAVSAVRFTNKLSNHPVCLSTEGAVSVDMERTLNSMPGNDSSVKAKTILEINSSHPIAEKIIALFAEDKEVVSDYSKILYAQSRLISGLSVDNPVELSQLMCKFLA